MAVLGAIGTSSSARSQSATPGCVSDRYGNVQCPPPGGTCIKDLAGEVRCSPLDGGILLDRYKVPVCGPGQCVTDIKGDVFCSSVPRKDECGLGQVHFSRDGLHFVVTEATAIEEDRERIALKRPRGEHVILNKSETAGKVSHSKLDSTSKPQAAKFLGLNGVICAPCAHATCGRAAPSGPRYRDHHAYAALKRRSSTAVCLVSHELTSR